MHGAGRVKPGLSLSREIPILNLVECFFNWEFNLRSNIFVKAEISTKLQELLIVLFEPSYTSMSLAYYKFSLLQIFEKVNKGKSFKGIMCQILANNFQKKKEICFL